jgi:hypothetical protein
MVPVIARVLLICLVIVEKVQSQERQNQPPATAGDEMLSKSALPSKEIYEVRNNNPCKIQADIAPQIDPTNPRLSSLCVLSL